MQTETDFESLKRLMQDYAICAHKLEQYRRTKGFLPGAKVILHGDNPEHGVIPPYGPVWGNAGLLSVPVSLDEGREMLVGLTCLSIYPDSSIPPVDPGDSSAPRVD